MAQRISGGRRQRRNRAILARDDYTCRDCGHYDASGLSLEVHHIARVSDTGYDPDQVDEGLITLCKSCHSTISKSTARGSYALDSLGLHRI